MEIKKENDDFCNHGIDAFEVVKKEGKYALLGSVEMLGYKEMSDRIKGNIDAMRKIQEKKLKAQAEYESKESKVKEV